MRVIDWGASARYVLVLAGFADGNLLVLQVVSRLVIGVFIKSVHVVRRAGELEEFVKEMLRIWPGVRLEGFTESSASDMMLRDQSKN